MGHAQAFATHVVDLLGMFGQCEARRMFGGYGIFHDGLMLALIADGELYLKADTETRERFEAEACEPFVYYSQGKPRRLSYYQAPEAFFDDAEARLCWARLAFDAALRSPRKKAKKSAG